MRTSTPCSNHPAIAGGSLTRCDAPLGGHGQAMAQRPCVTKCTSFTVQSNGRVCLATLLPGVFTRTRFRILRPNHVARPQTHRMRSREARAAAQALFPSCTRVLTSAWGQSVNLQTTGIAHLVIPSWTNPNQIGVEERRMGCTCVGWGVHVWGGVFTLPCFDYLYPTSGVYMCS